MKLTSIQNKLTAPISFVASNIYNMTPNVGLLSIQNSDKLNFEKNLKRTQNADAVQSNPIKAIGYKFAKAYNILFSPKYSKKNETTFVPYMA